MLVGALFLSVALAPVGLSEERRGGEKGYDTSKVSRKGDDKKGDYRERGHKGHKDKGDHGHKGHHGDKLNHDEAYLVWSGKTLRTNRGKEFYDCEIIGHDPYGLTFRHRGGFAKLGFADLPRDVRDHFGYDEGKAREFVRKHHPPVKVTYPPRRVQLPPDNRLREGALAAYPRGRGRGRGIRNPYALSGPITNIAATGSVFGGFMRPYFAGSFGTPRLVTSVPGGFFTPNTLRVGARPIIDSPVAPGMTSYSQVRDARAGAVRAAVRATPRRIGVATPFRHHFHHRGGGRHK